VTTTTVASPTGSRKALPPVRYGLSGLVRSEWTKLRAVRSTIWAIGLTVVVGIAVGVIAAAVSRATWNSNTALGHGNFDPIRTSLTGVFLAQLTIGILGVLVVSAEYSTGTIRATFAAAPRRPMVLVAKALVFGVVALVACEIVSFASFFIGQALLTAPATHVTISSPGALRAVLGTGLYLCVIGLFALALAAIIRHTAGALSAFVGILLVLPLVLDFLPNSIQNSVQRFLPSQIESALIAQHVPAHSFDPWIGLILLAAYTAVLLVVGGVLLVRRDA
jgi:ABC-type transport system involved in multi-copper enzyme maturation permease subunit